MYVIELRGNSFGKLAAPTTFMLESLRVHSVYEGHNFTLESLKVHSVYEGHHFMLESLKVHSVYEGHYFTLKSLKFHSVYEGHTEANNNIAIILPFLSNHYQFYTGVINSSFGLRRSYRR